MTAKRRSQPAVGDVWRNRGDEGKGLLRDIQIERIEHSFVYATGVQSGRTTRIRLDNAGSIPGYYRISMGPGEES